MTDEKDGTREEAQLVVTFDDVTKTFGTHDVLKDVSCTLTGGKIYAVTWANGSGKSTFLRIAGHLLRPSKGSVVVKETALPSPTSLKGGHLSRKGISDRIGAEAPCVCLPQSGRLSNLDTTNILTREALRQKLGLLAPELALSPELTGAEAIRFLLGLRGIVLDTEACAALLHRVGLTKEDAAKRTKSCSTGQRQRLALAVLIASGARLWLLDEPGANLDATGKAIVRREARAAADRGALVLVATNDEDEAAWADEIIKLGGNLSLDVNNEPIHQPQAPSQRELSAKLTEGVAKVGQNTTNDFSFEGTNQQPSPIPSRTSSHPTSATPPAASRPSPLGEGGWDRILRRDLTTALRSKSSLAIMALFAITALLALSMALGGARIAPPLLAALLWVLLFFAASMGLGGTFASDEASGALLALRVYGTGQTILAGKTAFSFLMLACLALVLVPLFFVLLDAPCTAPLLLLATLVLGLGGLAAAGTLLSALTVGASARQASASGLLPVLLLPVILPVFLPAISLTSSAFGGKEAGFSMLVGMGLYDLLLLVGASLLFDAVWYED